MIIPFEKLYNTEFFISEAMAKSQSWSSRGNVYSSLGSPKISHTLLWFKNCSARITDSRGNVLEIEQNQLAYMAKGIEYIIEFFGTGECDEDTLVIHFQMTTREGDDIIPSEMPVVGIKRVEAATALLIENMCEESKKNVVCVPELNSGIYKIMSLICQKQKRRAAKKRYACILTGIELLEEDSDLGISEIAAKCGVSECYFRRLFKEYSGESPMDFRQRYRIEKAKQLLLSDEGFSVGEIAAILGFSDIYHFSKTFKKFCGVSPTMFLETEKRSLNQT